MKTTLARTFLICFIVLTSLSVEAQKKPFRDIHFSQHDFVDTVQIKIWKGAIIIPVEINGETKNLMFDTGANWGFWIGEEEEWMTPSVSMQEARYFHRKFIFFIVPFFHVFPPFVS